MVCWMFSFPGYSWVGKAGKQVIMRGASGALGWVAHMSVAIGILVWVGLSVDLDGLIRSVRISLSLSLSLFLRFIIITVGFS